MLLNLQITDEQLDNLKSALRIPPEIFQKVTVGKMCDNEEAQRLAVRILQARHILDLSNKPHAACIGFEGKGPGCGLNITDNAPQG